jgi:glutathione-independent formaldehyde dehydrogenase
VIELRDLVSVPFNVACRRCRACRETNIGVCLTVDPGRAASAYANFNLLKFPDKDQALSKIMDLTIAGARPVGLAAAASAQLLGAAVIMIGDMNEARLQHARNVGFVPIDLSRNDRLREQVAEIVGEPTVDSVIDAVGFEAKRHGGGDQPAIVLNQAMEIMRPAGAIGIP